MDRLLANKVVAAKYQKIVKDMAATVFTQEKLLKDIDAIDKATCDIIARDQKAAKVRKEQAGFPFVLPGGDVPDLRKFVAKRVESVAKQVEGKSKGYVPTMGFGPGGPGGFGPGGPGGPGGFGPPPQQPGEFLAPFTQEQLKLTAAQKKKVEELQKKLDAELDSLLTDEQKKQLKQMRQGR